LEKVKGGGWVCSPAPRFRGATGEWHFWKIVQILKMGFALNPANRVALYYKVPVMCYTLRAEICPYQSTKCRVNTSDFDVL